MGTGTTKTEKPKLIHNTPAPMGYGSLRELNDLDDSFYEEHARFDKALSLMVFGVICAALCLVAIGIAIGLYYATP